METLTLHNLKKGNTVKVESVNDYTSDYYKIGDEFIIMETMEVGSDNALYVGGEKKDKNEKIVLLHPLDVTLIKK